MNQLNPSSSVPALPETDNWRPKVLLIGTVIGAVVGLGTAYLLAKTSEESHGGPPDISVGDAIKSSVAVLGVMRAIASLGD